MNFLGKKRVMFYIALLGVIVGTLTVKYMTATIDDAKTQSIPTQMLAEDLGTTTDYPMLFVENQGQLSSDVLYYLKSPTQNVFFMQHQIILEYVIYKPINRMDHNYNDLIQPERKLLSITFNNANLDVAIERSQSEKDEAYKVIRYWHLYEGIDFIATIKNNKLSFEYEITSGTNPDVISMSVTGVNKLSIDDKGELVAMTPFGEFVQSKPEVYQIIGDQSVSIFSSFQLRTHQQQQAFGFEVDEYNAEYALHIDPILDYRMSKPATEDERVLAIKMEE